MARKSLIHFTSLLTSLAIVTYPLTAMAGVQSHSGTPGAFSGTNCRQAAAGHPVNGYKPTTVGNNLNVYKPNVDVNKPTSVYKPNVDVNKPVSVYKPTTNVDVNKPVSVYKPTNINNNIDINKPISVYKPIDINKNVNINNNIDNSKNIDVNKPITIIKNINDSKNININKSVVINQGNSQAEASAIAEAVAASSASASSVVNINGSSAATSFANSASNSGSGSFGGSSGYVEAPSMYVSDIGTIAVSAAEAPHECVYQEATVIKALHAICVAADGHEFPASHMVGDTWINSAYEGEVARCLPGSHLRVVVGKVTQSSEGIAGGFSSGQTLECAPHEALRHFKDGMLKCAVAVRVPDCTERTNLRKFGTGDMFISYRTKVCLQTHQEYSEQMSREPIYN